MVADVSLSSTTLTPMSWPGPAARPGQSRCRRSRFSWRAARSCKWGGRGAAALSTWSRPDENRVHSSGPRRRAGRGLPSVRVPAGARPHAWRVGAERQRGRRDSCRGIGSRRRDVPARSASRAPSSRDDFNHRCQQGRGRRFARLHDPREPTGAPTDSADRTRPGRVRRVSRANYSIPATRASGIPTSIAPTAARALR